MTFRRRKQELLLLVLVCWWQLPFAQGVPPNIVIIFSDDHGAADMGAYGNAHIRTPNLDQLAAEGMRFELAFASEAICTPSRASLLTGLYPLRHGAHRNHSRVYEGVKTLPYYFKPLGYRVALVGKTHFGPMDAFPFEFLPASGNSHSDSETKIADYFNSIDRLFNGEQPFLLVAATSMPHSTIDSGGGYPQPESYSPADIRLPRYLIDTPETRTMRAGYYDLVSRLDRDVGTILAVLEKSKAVDNTVVIYASDHGGGFPFEKWTNYDAGIHVPLLVRWPEHVEAGSATSALVSLVDILPTLMNIADRKAPDDIDGKSFLPILLGETDHHHDYIFATHTTLGINNASDAFPQRTARSARLKYILNLNHEGTFTNNVTEQGQGGWRSWVEKAATDDWAAQRVFAYQHRPAEEFYNLQDDPAELNNLIDDPVYALEIGKHRTVLQTWRKQQGDQGNDHPTNSTNLLEITWHALKQKWIQFWMGY